MGMRSRRTGQRVESEALKLFKEWGFNCRKTAASGAQEGYQGDIELDAAGGVNVEVKYSGVDRGCAILRRYLKPVDLVMCRAPGEGWLFVITPELLQKLLTERARDEQ